MRSATDTLRDILRREQEQAYADRTVIGGLSQFIAHWRQQTQAETSAGQPRPPVKEIADALADYADLDPRDRERAVIQALELLAAQSTEDAAERDALARDVDHRTPQSPLPAASPNGHTGSMRAASNARNGNRTSHVNPRQVTLNAPVTAIKGISTTYQERLARLGLHTVKDLLYHLPRRYDDYSNLTTINRLRLGDEVTIVGRVRNVSVERSRSGLAIVKVVITDGTSAIEARWFGQQYLAKQFHTGREIAISGQVDQYLGRLVFTAPEWEPLRKEMVHTGRLVPVYPLTKGVSARRLRTLIKETVDYWAPRIVDPVPASVLESANLMRLNRALQEIHFPESQESLERARKRLCFDEFLLLQLGLLGHRRRWHQLKGHALRVPESLIESFLNELPFSLTNAQRRALTGILEDMRRPTPMRRLLQGDVGSGKTVVAVAASLATIHNGLQVAVMAPTGILAEQHYQTISSQIAHRPEVRCALLTGSLPESDKTRIRDLAARGEIDLLVGTHALIQNTVTLSNLGLVVVDEQHRFGVLQRATLSERAEGEPHLLAMSATPIPRTLAMTLYGDLDISVLDELPPGRQQVITAARSEPSRERIYSFIGSQVEKGRQAFIVCPLIEASDEIDACGATEEYERLRTQVYPNLRLGLLHGRLSSEEKDSIMAAFKARDLDILVTTSVIEVGIDIPNASVIMIENADRFGLAQLHQLRGRVGRGEHKSYCILLSGDPSEAGLERLRIMEQTSDGFALAEEDLRLRGPGDFFGVRQHGLPTLKVASLSDTDVLELARREAGRLFDLDPDLSRPEHADLAASVKGFWSSRSIEP